MSHRSVRYGLLVAALAMVSACGAGASAEHATLHLAVTGGSGVAGVHYEIECDDAAGTATSVYVELEAEGLPSHRGAFAGADFADLFLVAGEGVCEVTATAMADVDSPLDTCAPATATVQVVPEATTEALLVINCGPPEGGVDVVTVINQVPVVEVSFDPGPAVEPCQVLDLTAKATDADGDAVTVTFEVTGPDDAVGLQWSADGEVLTFSSASPGTYTVTITASDGLGASVTSVEVEVLDTGASCA